MVELKVGDIVKHRTSGELAVVNAIHKSGLLNVETRLGETWEVEARNVIPARTVTPITREFTAVVQLDCGHPVHLVVPFKDLQKEATVTGVRCDEGCTPSYTFRVGIE